MSCLHAVHRFYRCEHITFLPIHRRILPGAFFPHVLVLPHVAAKFTPWKSHDSASPHPYRFASVLSFNRPASLQFSNHILVYYWFLSYCCHSCLRNAKLTVRPVQSRTSLTTPETKSMLASHTFESPTADHQSVSLKRRNNHRLAHL